MSYEDRENAFLLIASVRAALKNNVKHYAENGKLLETEEEILQSLMSRKEIMLNEKERIPTTTDLQELELVKQEFL